jgi:hypothetical protein
VDDRPENSLRFAEIQSQYGVKGTYYFRMVPQSFNKTVIQCIVDLGHEVGYHYETMDTCRGNMDEAYEEFCRHLSSFREIADVKTISMHGSPISKFDNRDIWKKFDYKKLGILGEPYFDVNFNELFYITDTGRRWDGHLYNVRDKATKENPLTNEAFKNFRVRTTEDLIMSVANGEFPSTAMMNFHPQRWNDVGFVWLNEFVMQNTKNQIKRVLLALRP